MTLASILLLLLAAATVHATSYSAAWDPGFFKSVSGVLVIPSLAKDPKAEIFISLATYGGGSMGIKCVEKKGGWWIGIGNDGFSVKSGANVGFTFSRSGGGWEASVGSVKGSVSMNGPANRVVLGANAASLDFGPLVFQNIQIQKDLGPPDAKGNDMGWCKRIDYDNVNVIQKPSPQVNGGSCTVDYLSLEP